MNRIGSVPVHIKTTIKRRLVELAGIVALSAGIMWASSAKAEGNCDSTAIQSMAPSDTTIVSAVSTAEPVPHCKVDGYVTTTDPGPNQVNFRLQLPDENWTGRFYFIGLGATAGYVPTDSQIPAGNPLVKGFAVAGTDTGQQNRASWAFIGKNEAQAVDYTHRGGHVTTVAAQQITKAYYGTDKLYRYHSGCSGGGRMGTEAITRHPEDYDGILLGAPGMGPKFGAETMLAFIHLGQQVNREPGAWPSPAKLKFVEDKVTEQCDELDGAKDGIVWAHENCEYDISQLQCKQDDAADCLTAPEVRTIEALLAGPQSPEGQIKHGYPISNMSVWSLFIGAPPPWPAELTDENMRESSAGYYMGNTLAQAYFGEEFNSLTDFDFNDQEQIDAWWDAAEKLDYGTSYSTDLSKYKDNGGKVIFWNGVSDPCCIDLELISYFNEVAKSVGGKRQRNKFARFYRVPGMAHCGGGTGPQDAPDRMLEALIDWVENDKAPAEIVTHRGSKADLLFADPNTGTVSGVVVPPSVGSDRDILLCPHPKVAKFNGKEGGEMDAANWSCK